MSVFELLPVLFVVPIVALLEAVLFFQSFRAPASVRAQESLITRSETNIEQRARRSLDPDWMMYERQLDAALASGSEIPRANAGHALVVGILGTMLALVLSGLLSFMFGGADTATSMITGLVAALPGSILGLFTHLAIAGFAVPAADRHVDRERERALERLQTCAAEHPPADRDAAAVDRQLEQLERLLSTHLEAVLRDVLDKLPASLDSLSEAVGKLEQVQAEQRAEITALVGQQEQHAAHIATSTAALAPVARDMLLLGAALEKLPAEVGAAWSAATADVHERIHAAVATMEATVNEVRRSVHALPDRLSQYTERAGEHLAEQFLLKSDRHVADLRKLLSEQVQRLGAEIAASDERWRSQSSQVLGTFAAQLHEPVLTRLEDVSAQLGAASSALQQDYTHWSTYAAELRQARAAHEALMDRSSDVARRLLEQRRANLTPART